MVLKFETQLLQNLDFAISQMYQILAIFRDKISMPELPESQIFDPALFMVLHTSINFFHGRIFIPSSLLDHILIENRENVDYFWQIILKSWNLKSSHISIILPLLALLTSNNA